MHDFYTARQIKVGGWLIEDDHLRLLCQRPRDHDLLALAVAQMRQRSIRQRRAIHRTQSPFHHLMILR